MTFSVFARPIAASQGVKISSLEALIAEVSSKTSEDVLALGHFDTILSTAGSSVKAFEGFGAAAYNVALSPSRHFKVLSTVRPSRKFVGLINSAKSPSGAVNIQLPKHVDTGDNGGA